MIRIASMNINPHNVNAVTKCDSVWNVGPLSAAILAQIQLWPSKIHSMREYPLIISADPPRVADRPFERRINNGHIFT